MLILAAFAFSIFLGYVLSRIPLGGDFFVSEEDDEEIAQWWDWVNQEDPDHLP